jgi:hypothetical protein
MDGAGLFGYAFGEIYFQTRFSFCAHAFDRRLSYDGFADTRSRVCYEHQE